jgi:hypothetical protein
LLSETDEYVKNQGNIKYLSLGDEIHLTCIVEPLPRFNSVVWFRNGKKILNSKYVNLHSSGDQSQVINDNAEYEDSLVNVEITYANTTQGLRSHLKSTILLPGDFTQYSCKAYNSYGASEIRVALKEDVFLTDPKNQSKRSNLKLKFYFFAVIILFVLFCVFLIVACLIRNCLRVKRREKIKGKKSGRDATILSEDLRDYSASTNVINESSATSEKTVNDWLITTSPTTSSNASDTISKTHQFMIQNRHMPSNKFTGAMMFGMHGQTNDTDDVNEQDELITDKMLSEQRLVSPKTYYLVDLFQSAASPSPHSNYQYGTSLKPNIIHSNMKHIPYTHSLTRSYPFQNQRLKGVKFSDNNNYSLGSNSLLRSSKNVQTHV